MLAPVNCRGFSFWLFTAASRPPACTISAGSRKWPAGWPVLPGKTYVFSYIGPRSVFILFCAVFCTVSGTVPEAKKPAKTYVFSYICPGGCFHPFLCRFLHGFRDCAGGGKPAKTCIFFYIAPSTSRRSAAGKRSFWRKVDQKLTIPVKSSPVGA